jgi:hypothetical protein
VLLVVVPWTQYWERNFFVELAMLRPLLLDPYLRGAISGIGVVTLLAGLAELLDLVLRRAASRPESAGTAN